MGGQQNLVKIFLAEMHLSVMDAVKYTHAFGSEPPGGSITAFEGCCPTKPGNAPPGEAPQKERSLMNIVLNSLDKDRVKSASVFI